MRIQQQAKDPSPPESAPPKIKESLSPWSWPAGEETPPHSSTITRPQCRARGVGGLPQNHTQAALSPFCLAPQSGSMEHPTDCLETALPKPSQHLLAGKVLTPNKHTNNWIIHMEPADLLTMSQRLRPWAWTWSPQHIPGGQCSGQIPGLQVERLWVQSLFCLNTYYLHATLAT